MKLPSRLLGPALCALAAACARGRERLSALLVTLDTTRADALSCYGVRAGTTPNLDRIAGEGVLYERAYTTAPITLPAHASMLTGLYPIRHGLRDNGIAALSPEARTLAEAASEAGVQTAAFVGAVVLDRAFGLDQGFERYDGPRAVRSTEGHPSERPAGAVIDAALEWLAARDRSRPFFLWVHLYDAHFPYEAGAGSAGPGRSAAADHGLGAYLAEVARVDRELGRLLEALRAEGELERALVCIAADHGEAFGEHQELTHGPFCWDTTLRIPLILRYPDGPRAGERSRELASAADVAPTLAEALGIALGPSLDGRSLFRRGVPADRGLYFESYSGFLALGWSPLAGWLDASGKYLHSSAPELYDLARDPAEQHDLAAERAGALEPYRAAIDRLASAPALGASRAPRAPRAIDGTLRSEIRDLGYAALDSPQALPHPLAPSGRPSPHRMVGLWRLSMTVQELLNQERFAEAEATCRRILAENPENALVRGQLASALMRLRRFEDALRELERLLAGPVVEPQVHYRMGVCLERLGRRSEAIASLQRAVELDPGDERFRQKLAEVRQAEAARAESAEDEPR